MFVVVGGGWAGKIRGRYGGSSPVRKGSGRPRRGLERGENFPLYKSLLSNSLIFDNIKENLYGVTNANWSSFNSAG